jgi:ferredoxin
MDLPVRDAPPLLRLDLARRAKGRGASRVEANKTHAYQRAKYYLLYAFLLAGVGGSAIGGMFDPICIAVRSIGLGVIPRRSTSRTAGSARARTCTRARSRRRRSHAGLPRADRLAVASSSTSTRPGSSSSSSSGPLREPLHPALLVPRALPARRVPRRLLALRALRHGEGPRQVHRLQPVPRHCQGADSPQGGVKWRQDECHMCMNCETACPEDVIKFRFLPNRKSAITKPDTSGAPRSRRPARGRCSSRGAHRRLARRQLPPEGHPPPRRGRGARVPRAVHPLRGVHEGVPEQRAAPGVLRGGHRGALDADPHRAHRLLRALVRALRPGVPDGRDPEDHEKEKLGIGQPPIKIGTAFYDHGRCLPWSMQTPCIVCEEFCPTSPKAIWVEEVDAPVRDSKPGPTASRRR